MVKIDSYLPSTNVQWAHKSFWALPMELLGDVGEVEGRFSPFGDDVNLSPSFVHGLR
jgi:hypothetical protein